MKKNKKVKKTVGRTYIAGFPLSKNAFYNKLYLWPNMEEIKA